MRLKRTLTAGYPAEKHRAASSCQRWVHRHAARCRPSMSVTALIKPTKSHTTIQSGQHETNDTA